MPRFFNKKNLKFSVKKLNSNIKPYRQLKNAMKLVSSSWKKYTVAWAKLIFEYSHVFNEKLNKAVYESLEEIEE